MEHLQSLPDSIDSLRFSTFKTFAYLPTKNCNKSSTSRTTSDLFSSAIQILDIASCTTAAKHPCNRHEAREFYLRAKESMISAYDRHCSIKSKDKSIGTGATSNNNYASVELLVGPQKCKEDLQDCSEKSLEQEGTIFGMNQVAANFTK